MGERREEKKKNKYTMIYRNRETNTSHKKFSNKQTKKFSMEMNRVLINYRKTVQVANWTHLPIWNYTNMEI